MSVEDLNVVVSTCVGIIMGLALVPHTRERGFDFVHEFAEVLIFSMKFR